MIGLSSVPGAFSKEVLGRLAEINDHPIVFPLSNPASQAECSFEDAMEATDERVIFASGTAFPSYKSKKTGEIRHPGQGNNMYIFPGLGLGGVLAHPKHMSDKMIYVTSKALADSLTEEETKQGWLYPSIDRIREVSAAVAVAVCRQSLDEGTATSESVLKFKDDPKSDELLKYVKSKMWTPDTHNVNKL